MKQWFKSTNNLFAKGTLAVLLVLATLALSTGLALADENTEQDPSTPSADSASVVDFESLTHGLSKSSETKSADSVGSISEPSVEEATVSEPSVSEPSVSEPSVSEPSESESSSSSDSSESDSSD